MCFCSHLRRDNSGGTVRIFVGIEEHMVHDMPKNFPGPAMGGVVKSVSELLFESQPGVDCGLVDAVQPDETDTVGQIANLNQ